MSSRGPIAVVTPWGNADELRERMLRPGRGSAPELVAQNQRERLFGAMVASVSTRGFAATRVADLVELSGVSSRTFYDLFEDKKDCFVATIRSLLERSHEGNKEAMTTKTWEEGAIRGAERLAEMIVAQPAAARMCLLEAYAAGPEVLKPLEEATGRYEELARRALASSPERSEMPPEMTSAFVGALEEIARNRLRRGKERDLPPLINDLAALVLSYRSPPKPLRSSARRPAVGPERLEGYDHAERALRAFAMVVAEQGYANATIDDVVKRASMSATTFYANFEGKEDALMAAIDSAGAQMVAAILPAFRRNNDWPNGVRMALGALFNFLAARPALARLVMVEVYAAGPAAVERREETLRPLEMILTEGRRRSPETPSIAFEAIASGIYSLAYKKIQKSGPASLPSLAPVCTYIALAPFIGAEEACAVANGDGRARGDRAGRPTPSPAALREIALVPIRQATLQAISSGVTSVQAIARDLGESVEAIQEQAEELERTGLAQFVERRKVGDATEDFYRSNLGLIYTDQWERLSITERERISAQIGHLIKAEVEISIETGFFDARLERALIRIGGTVDEQGWREISELHTELCNNILEIQSRAAGRLEESGEKGINTRNVLTLFEMPPM